MKLGACYWRFKGDKPGRTYKYGWVTHVQGSLYRMGLWLGDSHRGPIVHEDEVEVVERRPR